MHQSGHERAHSMQTVQLSSRRAITPRARVGGDSLTCGYWTVLAPSLNVRNIVPIVTPRPLTRPGTFGIGYTATFRTAVTTMLSSETGISTFHANRCN